MSRGGVVGAFFDLDGTLLAAPSVERRFVFYLLMRGRIGPAQLARGAARFLTNIVGNSHAAMGANKAYFSGVSVRCVDLWSRRLAAHPVKFLSDGVDRLRFHFAEGHRIFLMTGAPATLAEPVAGYFPVPLTIVGTRLEARDGLWTGEITGGHMCGEAKQRAIVHLAAKHSLDLTRSFAYGDRLFDLPMLETVGHPAAVNPSKNLERAARDRNWPVFHWSGRWREAQNPRAESSRDTVQALRRLHASLIESMNFRGTHR